MSQLEKTASALDELAKRRKLNILPQVDFEAYMHARQEDKDAVKRPYEFSEEIMLRLKGANKSFGATMPWTKTHEQIRFRPSEVTMWSGFNGHKKSMVLGYLSLSFIQQNQPVCIASFEMKPASTIARILKQAT